MPDLKPDIEDLLRRASEAYPLKDGEDRWDQIAAGIHPKPAKKPVRKKRGFGPLVLLFAFLFAFLMLDQNHLLAPALEKQQESPSSPPSLTPHGNKGDVISATPGIQELSIEANHKVPRTHAGNDPSSLLGKMNDHALSSGLPGQAGFPPNQHSLQKQPLKNDRIYFEPHFQERSMDGSLLQQLENVVTLTTIHPDKESQKTKGRLKEGGFCYGLTTGIHLNAIKDQGFKKKGFHIGLIAGFRFNEVLSLESGLLFEKKFYWTPGKYFNTDKMRSSMPGGMEMTEVHGSARIVELPVHLRFDFYRRTHHRFYSSAGISSYIMTRENNQYHTMHNGTAAEMYGSYRDHRGYFAASIDLALGFETDLGRKNQVRIEPYLQLPTKGIGVGELPVKSTGIRIGITRSAH